MLVERKTQKDACRCALEGVWPTNPGFHSQQLTHKCTTVAALSSCLVYNNNSISAEFFILKFSVLTFFLFAEVRYHIRGVSTRTWEQVFHGRRPLFVEAMTSRNVAATRGQWGRRLRERLFEPSRRSLMQLIKQQGSLKGYRRSFSYGGYGGGDAQTVVWGLIGANLLVFGLWHTVDRRVMTENFMVSVNSVMSGRIHTVVTSAFSQARLDHLLPNMLGLYFFGTEIAQIFGGRWLLNLYLAGGIAGSIGHLVYSAFVVPWLEGIPQHRFNARYTPSALGASGAVNAIVLLHILLFPTRIIMVNLFIPVPAALFGVYLIGSDVWQARNEGSRTAHAGHLGGALVGALAWLSVRRRWG